MAKSPPDQSVLSRHAAKAESRQRDLEAVRSGAKSADEINAANGVLAQVAPSRIRIVSVRGVSAEPGRK